MGKLSTLVGSVVDGSPKKVLVNAGEQFYTIDVKFNKVEIPVLISQYLVKEAYSGVIEVTGCLLSNVVRHDIPIFYFYASKITNVDADTPLTNELNFEATVTKVLEFKTDNRMVDILPLTTSFRTPLHNTSILYLSVRDKDARKLKDKEKGYSVSGTGYLKKFRDVYEIVVKDIEVTDKP